MKNIHILPTDKPSRLAILHDDKLHIGTSWKKDFNVNPQHIYITSDVEIKEGDWYLFKYQVIKCENPDLTKIPIVTKNYCKKIILTTDQDLIADGVQAIDDEFLEWFVKNPSCEEVEIINEQYTQNYHKDIWHNRHKIIIPKEENSMEAKERAKNYMSLKGALEPKQIKCYCGHTTTCDCGPLEEPKQETLEEAAKIFVNNRFSKQISGDNTYPDIYASKESIIESHILFAKWQQERSYSEEDMISFAHFYFQEEFNSTMQTSKSTANIFKEWFEQFKKK